MCCDSRPERYVMMKRCCDVTLSLVGLVLCAPVMILLGLIVKMQTPGPMIYSQERVGLRDKPFTLYKLRSMIDNAEREMPLLASKNDERVTRIGRFMRRYRLDELPNLWNVLKGDMSIVGPRPERRYFIERLKEVSPHYTTLLDMRPGLTSWGMVKYGYASSIEGMVERMRYDLMYREKFTPSLDFKILILTIRTLLKGEGV
ncbi:MAG: sugar transferase [Duncaniella sp.]|nr:sugar transferase [Muribaculum sp.]MCM1255735.1 sugar transferase [Duncaniella sp.]